VDDRNTAALYLELVNTAPEDYQRRRVPELLACDGAQRVTWWRNLAPGRSELPMKVADGTLLGVTEADESFLPPPWPASTAGLAATTAHFHRYPRSSQGRLTGRPTTGLLVVWISPKRPELAKPVRDWADFVHLNHIAAAAVPGYTTITPYENVTGGDPRFMHLYEMDTDDPESAYQLMPKLVAERLGGVDAEAFREWADWRTAGAHIIYCNTFLRVGEAAARPLISAGPE
jgi:hypothetical protein